MRQGAWPSPYVGPMGHGQHHCIIYAGEGEVMDKDFDEPPWRSGAVAHQQNKDPLLLAQYWDLEICLWVEPLVVYRHGGAMGHSTRKFYHSREAQVVCKRQALRNLYRRQCEDG